ncbi:MAG: hypothetical protein M3461_15440 [Pseudomonadota bacterium]|nr:hypothetical protein [Pseudomonadota bacterium]
MAYSSAHVDGVESELIVRSSHSCHGDPRTIEEVELFVLRLQNRWLCES